MCFFSFSLNLEKPPVVPGGYPVVARWFPPVVPGGSPVVARWFGFFFNKNDEKALKTVLKRVRTAKNVIKVEFEQKTTRKTQKTRKQAETEPKRHEKMQKM